LGKLWIFLASVMLETTFFLSYNYYTMLNYSSNQSLDRSLLPKKKNDRFGLLH